MEFTVSIVGFLNKSGKSMVYTYQKVIRLFFPRRDTMKAENSFYDENYAYYD